MLFCTLLLTTTAQPLSRDYVTFRYFGRRTDNFKRTEGYPTDSREICSTFKAVCSDIRLNECVPAHPEAFVPYSREVTDRDPGRYVFDPPKVNDATKGKYMMVSNMNLKYEAGSSGLKLFSGCDEGCNNCLQGTGFALYPVTLPMMCASTREGDVFSILYSGRDAEIDTTFNCVPSLAAYWDDVDDAQQLRTTISLSVVGGLMFGVAMCALAFWFCYHRRRKHDGIHSEFRSQILQFQMQMQNGINVAPGAQLELPGGRIIGNAQIEEEFPIVSVTDSPQCVVCILPIQASENARRLQCNHVFHADCISAWWLHAPRSSLECPVCKRSQHFACEQHTVSPAVIGGTEASADSSGSPEAGADVSNHGTEIAPASTSEV